MPDAIITEKYFKVDRPELMVLNSWGLRGWEWEDGTLWSNYWAEDNMPEDNLNAIEPEDSDDEMFERILGCKEKDFVCDLLLKHP